MPADFALLALPGAYYTSVGALLDSFGLAQDRVKRIYADHWTDDHWADHQDGRMETRLRVLSQDGAPVALHGGGLLPVDGAIDEGAAFAFVWIPAFVTGGQAPLKARLAQAQPVLAWLRRQAEGGAVIGASAAAALLPVAAGLTRDVAVPVASSFQPIARAMFPRQRFDDRAELVDHGNLLMTSGIASDLHLVMRAVERLLSADLARWLSAVTGADFAEQELLAPDPLVGRARLLIEQRFAGPLSIAELARELSTSPATLGRRFHKVLGQSPQDYLNQVRVRAAKQMLAKSARPIETIAQLVGYSDSRLFRAMFRRRAGVTASQWRAAARGLPLAEE